MFPNFSPSHPNEMIEGTDTLPSWKELYPNIGDRKCEFVDSELTDIQRCLDKRGSDVSWISKLNSNLFSWLRLRRLPHQPQRNLPEQDLNRHGNPREGQRLREGPNRGAEEASPGSIREHRLHPHQLDEISHKLLLQSSAQQNVLLVSGSALQEIKAQVANHQPVVAERIRLRSGKRRKLRLKGVDLLLTDNIFPRATSTQSPTSKISTRGWSHISQPIQASNGSRPKTRNPTFCTTSSWIAARRRKRSKGTTARSFWRFSDVFETSC